MRNEAGLIKNQERGWSFMRQLVERFGKIEYVAVTNTFYKNHFYLFLGKNKTKLFHAVNRRCAPCYTTLRTNERAPWLEQIGRH